MKVKMYFENEDDLHKCYLKWQKRLGLQDWCIGVGLVDPEDMEEGRAGESDVQWVNKCGTIKILKKEHMPTDLLIKQPHEASLIHEMLHFKFVAFEEKSREESIYQLMQHQKIEELARALFMAEYNLQPNWFWEKDDK